MSYNVRASRLALTNLILFFLTWYYQVPERAWSLVTVWFVMFEYNYVGGVWTKSLYRFLGTLLSSIYGLFIIYFFYNDVIIDILAFIPAIFMYVYFFMDTERSYIGTIGCVTLSIVLLNHNDIDAAILRTFNIFLGILTAVFMMRFFYPQYARDNVMEIQAQFIVRIETVLNALMDTSLSLETLKKIEQENEHNMNSAMATFNTRLKEAQIETRTVPDFVIHHQKAMDIIRNIARMLSTLVNTVAIDEVCHNVFFQDKTRQFLEIFATLKQRLIPQVERSLSQIISTTDIILDDTFRPIENVSQKEVAFFLLEAIQKEISKLVYEIDQIVSLYQAHFLEVKRA
jgi:uncharacterized membrane protein YccC